MIVLYPFNGPRELAFIQVTIYYTQSNLKAISKQSQSNLKAISKQSQSNLKAISKQSQNEFPYAL